MSRTKEQAKRWKKKRKRKSSKSREKRKRSIFTDVDSLERKAKLSDEVSTSTICVNKTSIGCTEEFPDLSQSAAEVSPATVMSKIAAHGSQEAAVGLTNNKHYNNGYVQREVLLKTILSSDARSTKTANHLPPQPELVLHPKTLDDTDASAESESLTPTRVTKQQNGTRRPSPRRSTSFPTRPRPRSRTGSVNSQTSTSSKWTAIKHAVKITHTMAKHQKTKQDSFMEK